MCCWIAASSTVWPGSHYRMWLCGPSRGERRLLDRGDAGDRRRAQRGQRAGGCGARRPSAAAGPGARRRSMPFGAGHRGRGAHLPPGAAAGRGREDPLTARLIDAFARRGQPRRLVYISTTGVYGDCDGAWVDETRPGAGPRAERSLRRWDAEQQLRRWSSESGAELVILRVAGIYACDRLPLARIRSAQPVVRPTRRPGRIASTSTIWSRSAWRQWSVPRMAGCTTSATATRAP
jgi:hypothetical protein